MAAARDPLERYLPSGNVLLCRSCPLAVGDAVPPIRLRYWRSTTSTAYDAPAMKAVTM
jgi:hypothetical protein